MKDNLISSQKQTNNTLYIVFKYVAIGSGIIGIGFLIVFIGILLTSK